MPYRQVVVSLPFEVRGLLAFRPPVLNAAVRLIDDTVIGWQRRRSGGSARVGGLSVLQRAGGSLNIHPHLHLLVADGAWHEQGGSRLCRLTGGGRGPEHPIYGELQFRPTPTPTLDEVAALADRIARRLRSMLERRGLTLREDVETPPPEPKPDPLGGCIQIALGLGHRERAEPALALAADEPPRPPRSDAPRRSVSRVPRRAGGTEQARLAAEGEDLLVPAAGAAQAGEAGRRQPAGQVGAEGALDEARQRDARLLPAGAEEFPQMLADDPVENGVLRPMALVVACHAPWRRSLRALPMSMTFLGPKSTPGG